MRCDWPYVTKLSLGIGNSVVLALGSSGLEQPPESGEGSGLCLSPPTMAGLYQPVSD